MMVFKQNFIHKTFIYEGTWSLDHVTYWPTLIKEQEIAIFTCG